MNKSLLLILFTFGVMETAFAQSSDIRNSTTLGFELGQHQKDFGIGANLTTPFFFNNTTALRARVNLKWLEHLDSQNETTWTPYTHTSLGMVVRGGQVSEMIRLYGEGGISFLFPSDEFSTADFDIGGYGLFGFEFFFEKRFNYFIEIGGMGTGATADLIDGNPIYSNGLITKVGFRAAL